MACFSPSTLRHLTRCQGFDLRAPQRRWARVLDVRFLATQQNQERITDRYRQKLDQKAKQEGHKDISQLKEAYKDKISNLRKQASVPGATAPLKHPESPSQSSSTPFQQSPPPPPQPQENAFPSSSNHKTLSSFLDVPKTLSLPPKEIENIWRLRHAGNKQSLCASMPTATFEAIARNARKHPQFILPGLPREAPEVAEGEPQPADAGVGAPIHFLQWTFPAPDIVTVMFTHLAEYKIRGEYAQPHTTLTHHTELAGPKGLVLCQGSVMEGRGVSVEEGKWLVMCMQKFYNLDAGQGDELAQELRDRRKRLMEQFSRGDQGFKVETLLEEAERMG